MKLSPWILPSVNGDTQAGAAEVHYNQVQLCFLVLKKNGLVCKRGGESCLKTQVPLLSLVEGKFSGVQRQP